MSTQRVLLSVFVLATLLVAVPTAAGAKLGTLAGSVPGSLPTKARGETDLLVFSLADRRLVAARTVARTGRFSLRLPAGGYAVRTSIVDRRASAPSTGLLAVSLRSGQRRAKVALKVRRRPVRRRAKARFVQESGKTSTGTAVSIEPFTGAKGDWSVLNKGLSDMLTVDAVQQTERCKASVLANSQDRELIQDELDLQKSSAFDPKTRVTRDWIQPDITVTGTLRNSGSGLSVTLTLTDTRSGQSLGTIQGKLSGSDWVKDSENIAKELSRRICRQPEAYQVSVNAQSVGEFSGYRGTGTVDGLLLARAQNGDEDTAPTMWRSEPSELDWTGVTIGPSEPDDCSWAISGTEGQWQVKIAAAPEGMITVTTEGLPGAHTKAIVLCPEVPDIPLEPWGAALAGLAPETFTLPAGGGTQNLSGARGPWLSTGTITVRPSAPPG